jgi:6-phosphogluconolactonase
MEYFFAKRSEASRAAAAFIADRLRERLASTDTASLVVSGGSTPVHCFERLATASLQWSRVRVLMSDERWVPADDEDSNERLVREHLLQGTAGAGTLLPVYAPGRTPAERCAELDAELARITTPFACTMLGMGSDGHFASLFPDAENLVAGLDPDNAASYIPVTTAASPHPRVSMTLSSLLDSDAVLLLIFGRDKRDVYESAAAGAPGYPVSALLGQERSPVHVFWAQ